MYSWNICSNVAANALDMKAIGCQFVSQDSKNITESHSWHHLFLLLCISKYIIWYSSLCASVHVRQVAADKKRPEKKKNLLNMILQLYIQYVQKFPAFFTAVYSFLEAHLLMDSSTD